MFLKRLAFEFRQGSQVDIMKGNEAMDRIVVRTGRTFGRAMKNVVLAHEVVDEKVRSSKKKKKKKCSVSLVEVSLIDGEGRQIADGIQLLSTAVN